MTQEFIAFGGRAGNGYGIDNKPRRPAAQPPTLFSVDAGADLHPAAAFNAAAASSAEIRFASSPDRASDGSFRSENIVDYDSFTDGELRGGSWSYEYILPPGHYWVMITATDYGDCARAPTGPECGEGASNVLELEVPRPDLGYATSSRLYYYLGEIDLKLTVDPLGEDLPYRLCWRRKSGARRCTRSTVEGRSWTSSASDTVEVSLRGLASRTTFVWYVDGEEVDRRRLRTGRPSTRRAGQPAPTRRCPAGAKCGSSRD